MKSPVDRDDARFVLRGLIYAALLILVAALLGLSLRVFLLASGL